MDACNSVIEDLTLCTAKTCPWRKECLRYCPPSKIPRGWAHFVSPWTKEGCEYFLTEDLMGRRENDRLAPRKDDC